MVLLGRHGEQGLTLLETLIAAFILLFVMLSMITAYGLGRIDIDREEVKRKAVGVAQDRLEQVKARFPWAHIDNVARGGRIDTTYAVDGTTFTLTAVVTDSGNVRKNVVATVAWDVRRNDGSALQRSILASTTITRDITPEKVLWLPPRRE